MLRRIIQAPATVLEVASGSGEHAAYFAQALGRGVAWQPSDPDLDNRRSIAAWTEDIPNVARPPLDLDTTRADMVKLPAGRFDALVCINMIHVAPWQAAQGLARLAAQALRPGGHLFIYGPFRLAGRHVSPSNAEFDADLRSRNPAWGIRDLEAMEAIARENGLRHLETIEMPANNRSVIFLQTDAG